jgi:Asp-tRNA(Asn)/Glu-tRNA(Gln) amidotransferase A subunit family amidase
MQTIHTPSTLLTTTADDLSRLLHNGTATSVQLVQEYQRRIKRGNKAGLWLNPLLLLAPQHDVLAIAKESDEERMRGASRGILHGITFVVKVFRSVISNQSVAKISRIICWHIHLWA